MPRFCAYAIFNQYLDILLRKMRANASRISSSGYTRLINGFKSSVRMTLAAASSI